jgi:DNA-binding response OmpR family regulator
MICDLLEEVLTQAGHQVVTAHSGEEALQLFQKKQPNMTLLDLALPDMDGVTVLRRLRKIDATAPVVALTGFADPGLENEVRKLGVTDFLRKNLELEILMQSVAQAIGSPVHRAVAPPEALEGSARILVVDDEPDTRQLLEEFLTREGYRVATAADGEEALERVEDMRPHLVLLDLMLPKIDGLAVLRQLSKEAPEVGVIVISGATDDAPLKEAMKLGSFDAFARPVDLEQLGISVRAKLALMEVRRLAWWRRWLGLGPPEGIPNGASDHPGGGRRARHTRDPGRVSKGARLSDHHRGFR